MKFTFISAHRVQGLIHEADTPDIHLYHDDQGELQVTITSDVNRHLHLINRHTALAVMMLSGLVGSEQDDRFDEALTGHLAEIGRERTTAAGKNGVVIVSITGDVAADMSGHSVGVRDFVVCFDAFNKEALRARLRSRVNAVLTALTFHPDGQYKFTHIADGSYLTRDDGVIIHSFEVKMGAVGLDSQRPIGPSQAEQAAKDITIVLQSPELEGAVRLYVQSLDLTTDNYRSFLAAFSGLEVLINKLSKAYEARLMATLGSSAASAGLGAYLDRIRDVMKDKYTLIDRFAVVSIFLDSVAHSVESANLKTIKKVRDRLSHGEEFEEESLPTQEAQRLFRMLLSNHLSRPL